MDNPKTFSDLETALQAMEQKKYSGIGLRISGQVGCIDVDDSVSDNGELSGKANAVLQMLPEAFAELSPSRHGLHLYFLLPEGFVFDRDEYYINNRTHGMEIYLPEQTRRYMTVTGFVHRPGSLRVTADELRAFCETFMRRPEWKVAHVKPPEGGSGLSDEEVMRLCCSGPKGAIFEKYYHGQWENPSKVNWSHSEADLSVCSRLAYFTGGNTEQMNRLFRTSGLYREKWEQDRGGMTYGEKTMMKAIQGCKSFYEPKKKPAEAGAADPATELDQWLARDLGVDGVLSETFLGLALWARDKDLKRYVQVREKIPKMLGIRNFEAQLKKLESRRREEAGAITARLQLSDCDTGDIILPPGWIVDDNGIRHRVLEKGVVQEIQISGEPVFISRKLVDVDDHTEKLELTYRRNGRYRLIVAPRSDLMNRNTIVRYADDGLPVYSGNAAQMTKYLAELEQANNQTIPVIRWISRAGWIGSEFFPYGTREEVRFANIGNDAVYLLTAMHSEGQEEVWMDMAGQVRTYPFARCILAASFAAPLLKLLSRRNIYLHVWFASKAGKSAVTKLALAVWGNPDELMGTYNTTLVGMEERCAMLRNLPVGLDELQSLKNNPRLTVNNVVYNLGNGVGKTQGRPNNGIRRIRTWKTCIISTGEEPMSSDSSMDGVNTRLMEVNGCPLMDEDGSINEALGQRMHAEAARHYGFAGEKLIRYLQEEGLVSPDSPGEGSPLLAADFQTVQDALKEAVSEESGNSPHFSNTAVLALADYYSSVSVFHEPPEQALREAVAMGARVLAAIEADRPKDSITRAWEFANDWIASNQDHFYHQDHIGKWKNEVSPVYGIMEEDRIYVICTYLNEALAKAGFSYRKCIKGFADAGYIETITDSDGKVRSQVQKCIGKHNTRSYVLPLNRVEGNDRSGCQEVNVELPKEFQE